MLAGAMPTSARLTCRRGAFRRSGASPPGSGKTGAFTLLEILVVVVMLGILAAVVVVQVNGATREARESALRANLRNIRNQIKIYHLHHGMYPGYKKRPDGSLTSWRSRRFINQLLGKTHRDGTYGGEYGPYLRKFPANDFAANPRKAAVVRMGKPNGKGPGWAFNPYTGSFRANDSEHQSW